MSERKLRKVRIGFYAKRETFSDDNCTFALYKLDSSWSSEDEKFPETFMGGFLCHEVAVEVPVPTESELVLGELNRIEEQKRRVLREFTERTAQLNEQASKLQALAFNGGEQ